MVNVSRGAIDKNLSYVQVNGLGPNKQLISKDDMFHAISPKHRETHGCVVS